MQTYNSNKENQDYVKLYVRLLIKNEQYKSAIDIIENSVKEDNNNDFAYLKTEALLNVKKYDEAINILYNLPQEKKDNEEFDYMLLWAYILRAQKTKEQNHINEMNDFSYYLSQKYGKNNNFMVKLKMLEEKYKHED